MSETIRISVRINLSAKSSLQQISDLSDTSISDLVRISIDKFIEEYLKWRPFFEALVVKQTEISPKS